MLSTAVIEPHTASIIARRLAASTVALADRRRPFGDICCDRAAVELERHVRCGDESARQPGRGAGERTRERTTPHTALSRTQQHRISKTAEVQPGEQYRGGGEANETREPREHYRGGRDGSLPYLNPSLYKAARLLLEYKTCFR